MFGILQTVDYSTDCSSSGCCCDLESSSKPTEDIGPRDSDSMMNFFEYPPDACSSTAEKCEEHVGDIGSTSTVLRTGTDGLPDEAVDEQSCSKESDARSENNEEMNLAKVDDDLSHKDDSKLLEVEESKIEENKETERTSESDVYDGDDLCSEEKSGTDGLIESPVKDTLIAADLPTRESTETIERKNEDNQVSPPGVEVVRAVEHQLEPQLEGSAVEPFVAETLSEMDAQEYEMAYHSVPTVSTTTSEDLGKFSDDVQLVAIDNIDALEAFDDASESAVNGELIVTDQAVENKLSELPDAEDLLAKTNEKTSESGNELHSGETFEPCVSSAGLTAKEDVNAAELGQVDDSYKKASSSVSICENDYETASASQQVDSERVDESAVMYAMYASNTAADTVADADGGDSVREMASHEPAAQSVLSARDAFIEHQVNNFLQSSFGSVVVRMLSCCSMATIS